MPSKPVNMTDQNEELEEVLDFDRPHFKFEPNEQHQWRQQGPYLVCKSCELHHAVYVGMDKVLIGIDEKGKPILKNANNYPDKSR